MSIARTYQAGGDPLPIFTAPCGFRHKVQQFVDRFDLVYVDVRRVSGTVALDVDGYLPHLQYTPEYAQTEEDRGEYVITGNVNAAPVFRFDPGPFFANLAGKVVLTGGAGDAVYSVTVLIKRWTKQFPLRHTLTIGTTANRMPRPFGASGLHVPCATDITTLSLGGLTRDVLQPNGGFAAFGAFDEMQFTADNVVTIEMMLPF